MQYSVKWHTLCKYTVIGATATKPDILPETVHSHNPLFPSKITKMAMSPWQVANTSTVETGLTTGLPSLNWAPFKSSALYREQGAIWEATQIWEGSMLLCLSICAPLLLTAEEHSALHSLCQQMDREQNMLSRNTYSFLSKWMYAHRQTCSSWTLTELRIYTHTHKWPYTFTLDICLHINKCM